METSLLCPWQIDPEVGSAICLAANFDIAAGLLGETKHHAEPKPGALAGFLGREKRFKNPVSDRVGNTGAGVGHIDDDVVAGMIDPLAAPRRPVQGDIVGCEGQFSTTGHGVASVDGEVDERGTELAGINMCRPQIVAQVCLDLDLPAERLNQKTRGFLDKRIDVDLRRPQRLLPGERQQICRQFRAPVGRVTDQCWQFAPDPVCPEPPRPGFQSYR